MGIIGGGFGMILAIIYLGLIGLSIYCMVLFIKLATRGIEALDNYNSTFRNRY